MTWPRKWPNAALVALLRTIQAKKKIKRVPVNKLHRCAIPLNTEKCKTTRAPNNSCFSLSNVFYGNFEENGARECGC